MTTRTTPALPWFVAWFARWPSRYAIPLIVLAVVVPVRLWINAQSWETTQARVVQATQATLVDRLHLEQTRLETQLGAEAAQGNWLGVRRLVSAWGLYPGITHAWLVDAQGRVQASLSRRDVGQSLESVLQSRPDTALEGAWALHRDEQSATSSRAAHTHALLGPTPLLLGHVSVYPQHHLLVQVDASAPLQQFSF
jgi:hypothetical protein